MARTDPINNLLDQEDSSEESSDDEEKQYILPLSDPANPKKSYRDFIITKMSEFNYCSYNSSKFFVFAFGSMHFDIEARHDEKTNKNYSVGVYKTPDPVVLQSIVDELNKTKEYRAVLLLGQKIVLVDVVPKREALGIWPFISQVIQCIGILIIMFLCASVIMWKINEWLTMTQSNTNNNLIEAHALTPFLLELIFAMAFVEKITNAIYHGTLYYHFRKLVQAE